MLECVVNISEGRELEVIQEIAGCAGDSLLDLHSDPDHNRSVLTLAGEEPVREVARAAVRLLDLNLHSGAHPRIGVVDVVPFVALEQDRAGDALAARDRYAAWSAAALAVPCFLYGPERTLPEIRRTAFSELAPDTGPPRPHPTAGASAVGQREVLVAYNLWLAGESAEEARRIARAIRSPHVRALGLVLSGAAQVSMNLVHPDEVGPAEVYDQVAREAEIARAELVGLIPAAVLRKIPRARWRELDLDESSSIEARLEALS